MAGDLVNVTVSRAGLKALVERTDLLKSEAHLAMDQRVNWKGRAQRLVGTGRAGGSALDRRLVAEAMAELERQSGSSPSDRRAA